jgi:hypothetical protein
LLEPYTLTRLREVQAVLRLREHYADERIERACQRALAAGDGHYRTVRNILERSLDTLEPELLGEPPASQASPALPATAAAFLRGPAAFAVGAANNAANNAANGSAQGRCEARREVVTACSR